MLNNSRVIAVLSVCVMVFGVVQPAFAEYRTGSKWGDAGVYGTVGGALAVGLLTLISGGAALPVLAVAAAGATGAGAAGYYGYKVEDKTILKDAAALTGSAIGGTAVGMVTTVAVYELGSAATAGGGGAAGGKAVEKAKDAFDEAKDKTGKILPSAAAMKHTPVNGHGGNWSGERGNSNWVMNPNSVPANKLSNPDKLSWNEINAKYGNNINTIPFKNGEPDLSAVAVDTVKIKNFTTSRYNNFTQADQTLAEKLGLNASDIARLRIDNNLTWHERADMGTMDLVPREYHSVPHSGGISNAKASY